MWIIVQYFKKYKKFGLKEPHEVIKKTKEYQQEMDRFQEFINANVMRTYKEDSHRIKKKDAHATYIDWMNENYSDTPKLQLSDFTKLMNKKFNMKCHDSSRVKTENGRRLTGKNADGWWGYLLKKEYVRLNCEDDNNSDIDDLSDTMSNSMITSAPDSSNTKEILNEMTKLNDVSNNIIKTNNNSSTKVEDELINDISKKNTNNKKGKK